MQWTGVAMRIRAPGFFAHRAEIRSRRRPRLRYCTYVSHSHSGQGQEHQHAELALGMSNNRDSQPVCQSPFHFVRGLNTCMCILVCVSNFLQAVCSVSEQTQQLFVFLCPCVTVNRSEGRRRTRSFCQRPQQSTRVLARARHTTDSCTSFKGNGGGLRGHSKSCSTPSRHRHSI